jgi:hypothetical protein
MGMWLKKKISYNSKMNVNRLAIILIVIVTGCGSKADQNFADLKIIRDRMKISEVHSIMKNDPINFEQAYWSDSLLVENYESGFGASDDYKIVYSKKDTTVVRIEWGD